jgi:hypothetical protein
LGALPDRDATYFKNAYRDLVKTVNTILAEMDPAVDSAALGRLHEYKAQFEDQLAYWDKLSSGSSAELEATAGKAS